LKAGNAGGKGIPGILNDGNSNEKGNFKSKPGNLGKSGSGNFGSSGSSNGSLKAGNVGGKGIPGILNDGNSNEKGNFKSKSGNSGSGSSGSSGNSNEKEGNFGGKENGKDIGIDLFHLKLYKTFSPNLASTVTTINIFNPLNYF
jgi:hypothetical protein